MGLYLCNWGLGVGCSMWGFGRWVGILSGVVERRYSFGCEACMDMIVDLVSCSIVHTKVVLLSLSVFLHQSSQVDGYSWSFTFITLI